MATFLVVVSVLLVLVSWSAWLRRHEAPKVELAVTVGVIMRMTTAICLGAWSAWKVLNLPPT